jgi:hypothetical protein
LVCRFQLRVEIGNLVLLGRYLQDVFIVLLNEVVVLVDQFFVLLFVLFAAGIGLATIAAFLQIQDLLALYLTVHLEILNFLPVDFLFSDELVPLHLQLG